MAKIEQKPVITISATFTVNESELRALEALAGYGDDAFIKTFYEKMGRVYLEPHEAGLREFLKSIREIASPILDRTDAARKVFEGGKQ